MYKNQLLSENKFFRASSNLKNLVLKNGATYLIFLNSKLTNFLISESQ